MSRRSSGLAPGSRGPPTWSRCCSHASSRTSSCRDFGYRALPLDPAYAALTPDGPIFFFNDTARTQASIAPFSQRDADAYAGFEELLVKAGDFLRPMLMREPPALGSKRPGDLLSLLREGARASGLGRNDVHDLVRIFTMSVGDLLDDWFETDGLKGSLASTGVVGVWAGPRTPGTAYNLLHHALGELDGVPGAWGQVIGGMGAISNAIARSAEAAGAVVRTGAEVARIDVRDGVAVGVTLTNGEELRAPVVASGAHPKTTVLDLAGAENFPTEVADHMRRYRTRGGSVKINMVLSEPPHFEGADAETEAMLHKTGVNLCPSIDYLETAWQDALAGRPAANPYVEAELPSAIDASLTDDGRYVMTMFTQYGPPEESPVGRRRPRALRGRLYRASRSLRPQRSRRHRGARGPGPAGHRAHLRLAGRIDLPRRAGPRPDGLHAPDPRDGALRHAGPRPLPLRRRHAPGRRGHGRRRTQRREANPSRQAREPLPPAPPQRRLDPRIAPSLGCCSGLSSR